ncbi:hypothetical protein [Hyphomicrobium sp. MC1]|uniref:hypothetical protein n=1 Tax=Hyphomicrobium sp. (strain MC1) TaxID=717785 RepID=UPI000213EDA2|nr:hypothetical protein [Hyphomicrobium sp. MC1]CCB66658.1 conserved exported protein of unknown function [Hyphomicrobium sp. MC1]
MRRLFIAMALFVGAMVGAAHADESAPEKNDKTSNMVEMPAANWLFVQTGTSFTSDGKTLTIHGVAPQTLMFSDRPERMTGDVFTSKFVDYWTGGKDDFEKDPPNATVSTVIDGKTDLVVVELLKPRLKGSDLTYDIRPLDGVIPASGKEISLFIDWWYGPGWHRRWGWGWGPGRWAGGNCWRGPWGHLHCRPWWGY